MNPGETFGLSHKFCYLENQLRSYLALGMNCSSVLECSTKDRELVVAESSLSLRANTCASQ